MKLDHAGRGRNDFVGLMYYYVIILYLIFIFDLAHEIYFVTQEFMSIFPFLIFTF